MTANGRTEHLSLPLWTGSDTFTITGENTDGTLNNAMKRIDDAIETKITKNPAGTGSGNVTTAELADGAVTNPKMGPGAVGASNKIADGIIADNHIKPFDDANPTTTGISGANLRDETVTEEKLAGDIPGSKLAPAVPLAQVNPSTNPQTGIDGDKLVDQSVPGGKLEVTGIITKSTQIANFTDSTNGITTAHLRDEAVTTDKIALKAIDHTLLADDNVVRKHTQVIDWDQVRDLGTDDQVYQNTYGMDRQTTLDTFGLRGKNFKDGSISVEKLAPFTSSIPQVAFPYTAELTIGIYPGGAKTEGASCSGFYPPADGSTLPGAGGEVLLIVSTAGARTMNGDDSSRRLGVKLQYKKYTSLSDSPDWTDYGPSVLSMASEGSGQGMYLSNQVINIFPTDVGASYKFRTQVIVHSTSNTQAAKISYYYTETNAMVLGM